MLACGRKDIMMQRNNRPAGRGTPPVPDIAVPPPPDPDRAGAAGPRPSGAAACAAVPGAPPEPEGRVDSRRLKSWFPGHVAATRSRIRRDLTNADLVLEVLDSRIPHSSGTHGLEEILLRKPRVVVLNRSDLAPPDVTMQWKRHLAAGGALKVMRCDATSAGAGRSLRGLLASLKDRLPKARFARRIFVIGIPNVGKSRLINALLGHSRARVANTPGVTRGPQWMNLGDGFELLDLPGVLPPGNVSEASALRFALCRIIPVDRVEHDDVCALLADACRNPANMARRDHPFVAAALAADPDPLGAFARAKNLKARGGVEDRARAMTTLLKEFDALRLGRFAFEFPPAEAERLPELPEEEIS